jgi:hypothetical protein
MYYSYVEIEYVAMSFSLARTDLVVKLLSLNEAQENLWAIYGPIEVKLLMDGINGRH